MDILADYKPANAEGGMGRYHIGKSNLTRLMSVAGAQALCLVNSNTFN